MAWPRTKKPRSSTLPAAREHGGVHVTAAPDAGPAPGSGQNTGISGTRHTVVDAGQHQTAHVNAEIASTEATGTGVIEGTVITGEPANAPGSDAPGSDGNGSGAPGSGGNGSDRSYDETSGVVYEASPSVGLTALGLEPDPEPAGSDGTSSPSRDDAAEAPAAEAPAAEEPGTPVIVIGGLGQARTSPREDDSAGPAWNQTTVSVHGVHGDGEDEDGTRGGLLRKLRGLFSGSGDDAAGGADRPLTRVRDLPLDQKLRIWRKRALIVVAVGAVFSIIAEWQVGLTLAVVAGVADTIYRARTVEPHQWTGSGAADHANWRAQRRTQRQLGRMERAGYVSLHQRPIPGSIEIIDHLVIGPTGVYAIDSERWDKELPIRTSKGRQLWLGPQNMKDRLEHASWEAAQASERLSRAMGTEIVVRPALAIYGPKVPWDIAVIREVDVFSGDQLKRYLRRRARHKDARRLDANAIATIRTAAEGVLPLVAGKAATPVG